MGRKLLFFDIDGTLMYEDGSHYIPDSAKQAIQKAREAGNYAFINTGRVMSNVEPMIREIGFDGYVCGCGTNIYFHEQELLHRTVAAEVTRQISRLLRACHVTPFYEAKDATYIDRRAVGNDTIQDLLTYFLNDGKPVGDVADADFHFDKFCFWCPEGSAKQEALEGISPWFDSIDRGIDRGVPFFENVPKGYSKATGMQFLLDYFQLEKSNCYAFGDSPNDLPMLEFAPNSVAMGGSVPSVCDIVDFVTKPIKEDGLAYAISHYGLC